MKNLWDKDRKIVFRELYTMYLKEGYSNKEAKRLAQEEANEMLADDSAFVKEILDGEEED
jgi:hypothetical protein